MALIGQQKDANSFICWTQPNDVVYRKNPRTAQWFFPKDSGFELTEPEEETFCLIFSRKEIKNIPDYLEKMHKAVGSFQQRVQTAFAHLETKISKNIRLYDKHTLTFTNPTNDPISGMIPFFLTIRRQ